MIYPSLTILICLYLVLVGLTGCQSSHDKAAQKSEPAAKILNPTEESRLTTVVLTSQANQRLGIETIRVQQRQIGKSIQLHGDVLAVPGFTATVSTPWTGRLIALMPHNKMVAGSQVRQGQGIFKIVQLPNDATGLGAQQDIEVKRRLLETVDAKVRRLESLAVDQNTSIRLVQEAQLERENAQASLNAAVSRSRFFKETDSRSDSPMYSSLVLKAPFQGVIQKVLAAPNQIIPAGSPLVEISRHDPVWIRVPVYAGDVTSINMGQEAHVQSLGDGTGASYRTARFVPGPPTADPQAVATDLYYELSNHDNFLQVGQKVNVTLTQKNNESGLSVPTAAIIYDIDGGTWIYKKTAPQTYTRQRVAISRIVNQSALIERGIQNGDEIVRTGAAELYGIEFGPGK